MKEFRSPRSRRGSSHMPCHSRRAETASRQSRPSLSSKSQVPARRTQLGSCGLLHLPSRVTHGPCALRLAWGGGVAPACRATVRWRPGRRSPWDAMAVAAWVAVTPYSTQPAERWSAESPRDALYGRVCSAVHESKLSRVHTAQTSLSVLPPCATHTYPSAQCPSRTGSRIQGPSLRPMHHACRGAYNYTHGRRAGANWLQEQALTHLLRGRSRNAAHRASSARPAPQCCTEMPPCQGAG